MKEIIQKLVRAEQEMAAEKGEFLLFALFLPEDAPSLWDLVVASPWIATDKADSLRYIADKVNSVLDPNEVVQLSRIVLIEPDDPSLVALQEAVHIEHGTTEIRDADFFGLPIKHAYLITSRRDVDHESKEPAQPMR